MTALLLTILIGLWLVIFLALTLAPLVGAHDGPEKGSERSLVAARAREGAAVPELPSRIEDLRDVAAALTEQELRRAA